MDTAQILTALRAQRDRISSAIAALEALNGNKRHFLQNLQQSSRACRRKTAKPASASVAKRTVSPEARQRMAQAQQKRWAKKKRAVKAAAKKVAAPVAVKTAKATPVNPRGSR